MGAAPTTRKKLKGALTSATDIRRPGGCATTAIALHIDDKFNPGIAVPSAHIQTWMEVYPTLEKYHGGIEKTWTEAYRNHSANSRWGNVHGHLSGVVALLIEGGWKAEKPDVWE